MRKKLSENTSKFDDQLESARKSIHEKHMRLDQKLIEMFESQLKLQKEERVTTYPINFSRGMSWNEKCLILDECQNSTIKEIVTLLTRIGNYSKIFICADPMQTDLKNGNRGAFSKLKELFSGEDSRDRGVHTFEFGEEDIVRSEILKFIVKKINTLE